MNPIQSLELAIQIEAKKLPEKYFLANWSEKILFPIRSGNDETGELMFYLCRKDGERDYKRFAAVVSPEMLATATPEAIAAEQIKQALSGLEKL